MSNKPEPILISSKGEMNTVAWSQWYRETTGATAFQAQMAFNEKVSVIPEPDITLASGKVNPVWIKWYRMRKRVSSNVAVAVARRRLAAIAEGKKPLEEHLTAWW